MAQKVFGPHNRFTPTQFSTPEDKAKFANHLVRFVQAGFPRTLFPKWFYRQLSGMFGHIAHYDINGFYHEWFSTPDRKQKWIARVSTWRSYGDPAWTYSDVEKVVQMWMRSTQGHSSMAEPSGPRTSPLS